MRLYNEEVHNVYHKDKEPVIVKVTQQRQREAAGKSNGDAMAKGRGKRSKEDKSSKTSIQKGGFGYADYGKSSWQVYGAPPAYVGYNHWQGPYTKGSGKGKYGNFQSAKGKGKQQWGKGGYAQQPPEPSRVDNYLEGLMTCAAPQIAHELGCSEQHLWDLHEQKKYCMLRGIFFKEQQVHHSESFHHLCRSPSLFSSKSFQRVPHGIHNATHPRE